MMAIVTSRHSSIIVTHLTIHLGGERGKSHALVGLHKTPSSGAYGLATSSSLLVSYARPSASQCGRVEYERARSSTLACCSTLRGQDAEALD